MMEVDEDRIVKLCNEGIFPKLSFLLENVDESQLKKCFRDSDYSSISTVASGTTGGGIGGEGEIRFPKSVIERENILSELLIKVQQLDWWSTLSPTSRPVVIIFLSENFDGSRSWSSSRCQSLVVRICEEICSKIEDDTDSPLQGSSSYLTNWFAKNFEDCLTPNESDFHNILKLVKVKYSKSGEWKYFPASVHGFRWIVKQIKYPFLGNDIDMVIPPALLFTDDHYDDHRELGLDCLSHIVHNVDKSDLMQSNWASVIYDAVFRFCRDKDPKVIDTIMPVLMKILLITEKDPSEYSSEFTKYDDVLKCILFEIDMCSDINLKRAWLSRLDSYLTVLGMGTLHWSDKICSMLKDATVCNDFPIWNSILEITSTVIRNTWVKADCVSISEIILKVLFNCSCFHNTNEIFAEKKSEIIENAKSCLELLSKCDGYEMIIHQFKEIIDQGESNLLHPNFVQIIKDILRY